MNEINSSTWQTLKRLKRYTSNNYCIPIYFFVALFGSIVEILMARPLKNMADMMLEGQGEKLLSQLIIIVALLPIGAILKYVGNYSTARFSTGSLENLRMKLSNHALRLPVEKIEKDGSSRIVACLTNDIPLVENFFQNTIPNLIYQPILFISIFLYLLTVNYELLLFSMVSIPIVLILNLILGKSIAKNSNQLQSNWVGVNAILADSLAGINVIKAFNLHKEMHGRYNRTLKDVLQKSLQIELRISWLTPLSFVIRAVPRIMCIAFGGYLVIQGRLTTGSLLVFIYLLNFLIEPASNIPKLISDFLTGKQILSRVFEIFDIPVEETQNSASKLDIKTDGDSIVEIRDVTFSYDGSTEVLKNINMDIPKGSMIALVGESGSGKSTLLKLLCGFYQPQRGHIRFLGNEINSYNLMSVREHISLLTQENFLFPLSVQDNIALGKENASEEQVIAAAKAANIHDVIMGLPEGYKTIIEEKGSNLSGGQRQRVCIARTILKDSSLVLLDEPTSALDKESEDIIKNALEQLRKDKTVVVIAHRLSTIKKADIVYLMKDGSILEKGSHDELIQMGGHYEKLYMNRLSVPN